MTTQTKFACNVCKQTFSDRQNMIRHFAAEHATTKCQLCSREAAKAGTFCPTCRKAFPGEIANLENEMGLLVRIKVSQQKLEKSIAAHNLLLRDQFLRRRNDMFCAHDSPKDEECKKCECKAEVRNVIKVSLDDFPASTLKRQTIKISL